MIDVERGTMNCVVQVRLLTTLRGFLAWGVESMAVDSGFAISSFRCHLLRKNQSVCLGLV